MKPTKISPEREAFVKEASARFALMSVENCEHHGGVAVCVNCLAAQFFVYMRRLVFDLEEAGRI